MLNFLPFIIIFFAVSFQAKASQPLIDIDTPQYQIGKSMSFYEDSEGQVNFSEIEKIPENVFQPMNQDVATYLFSESTYYYKFKVINTEEQTVNRIIVFETPWLDSIKVKIISKNGLQTNLMTGNALPFSQRAIPHPNPNVEHEFAPGVSEVFIEVKTRDPFIVPISITDQQVFLKAQIFDINIAVLIYGILASMILYHLVLFFSLKLRYYGFYVLYVSSFLLMNASYNSYTFEPFFAEQPAIQNWMQSSTIFLFSICGLLFARSFLNLKKYLPNAQQATDTLIGLFIVTMIGSAYFGYHYHVILAISMSILFSIFVFSIALITWLKGNQSARFFLLGTTAGLIGTSITALTVMSLIPYSYMGYHAIDFGMVIDSILLSFALVDKVKNSEKNTLRAETLAKTDELTGLLNRRAYNEIYELDQTQNKKLSKTNLSTMMIDIDHFKKVNDNFGHKAGDIVLQRVAHLIHSLVKTTDHVFRMGGEEFLILMPDTDSSLANHIAERIRHSIENLNIVIDNNTINITVSIGISENLSQENGIQLSEVNADKALYQAKQTGRNKVIFST